MGMLLFFPILYNHHLAFAGFFINLFLYRYIFCDLPVLNRAVFVAQNQIGIWIPLVNNIAFFDACAFIYKEFRAVRHSETRAHAVAVIENENLAFPAYYNTPLAISFLPNAGS